MKIYYDDIFVGEIVTNKSITVDEVLDLIDFNEQEFKEKHCFDEVDYNHFRLEVTE